MTLRILNIICLFLLTFASGFAEKHALIIAIGSYPSSGGWPAISSQNDVPHVKAALLKLGFIDKNISLVSDDQATYKGIISSFDNIKGKLNKGDVVYIHFSGHGQQVLDDNGDEIDLLDESIVPYDSPMRFKSGEYEGEKLIRDDYIGKVTDEMRKICGKDGQVILILDSCHSGTGTRGLGKVRGTDRIMAPDSFSAPAKSQERTMNISGSSDVELAPMASFFGASAKELNYETLDDQSKPVGSLTLAFTSVLANMNRIYTFEELFDRVKLKMKTTAPRQNPQWEGPRNVKILGGVLQNEAYSFKVFSLENPSRVKADMGTFFDIFPGSKVELVSRNSNQVVSRGEVTISHLMESTIDLETPIDEVANDLYEIKITQKAQAPLFVSVSNKVPKNSGWSNLVDRIVSSPMLVVTEENADLYLAEGKEDGFLTLETKEGVMLNSISRPDEKAELDYKSFDQKIRAYLQGKFLKSFDNVTSKFDFSLELVSVDCSSQQEIALQTTDDLQIKVGSCVRFRVRNNGVTGGYFSLMDIQPDNAINLVIPAINLGYTAEEYYLKAGESFMTDYIVEISEPLGEETLKLIVSKKPQDLSGIIMTQGNSKRGIATMDPFEQMLSATYNSVGLRGAKIRQSSDDEVGASTLYFKIVN